jgi:hypothetical protein
MTNPRSAQRAVRYLGAAALLGVGIDHLQQYFGASYSAIPTIGTLFALNFVAAVLLAAGLIAPLERAFRRHSRLILGFLAASGIGVALGSLIALLISEQTPLFGFREVGYRQAIVTSIVFEASATLLLGAFLAGLMRDGLKASPRGKAIRARRVTRPRPRMDRPDGEPNTDDHARVDEIRRIAYRSGGIDAPRMARPTCSDGR